MKRILGKILIVVTCLELLSPVQLMKAQLALGSPTLDYYELKGLLLKHERTVTNMLGIKRFKLVSSRNRTEAILYTYKKENSFSRIIVRVRKSDGLVSEIAWNEDAETFGNLTHEAVDDGFVPLGGNGQYHNRFQNMVLFVYYDLSDDTIIPCALRVIQ